MADFGKQLADLIPGQTPDEKPSPSALPSSVPITGEIKPYDPTFRESAASKIQRGLESMGVNRYKARTQLKKKGGKVKFTDNLDAMRLAVQKRK